MAQADYAPQFNYPKSSWSPYSLATLACLVHTLSPTLNISIYSHAAEEEATSKDQL